MTLKNENLQTARGPKISGRQFTGKHMALVMIGFFGVIITANLTMAYFASTSWTGLVVKNGYIASQRFNREQAEQAHLISKGWAGSLEHEENSFLFHLKTGHSSTASADGDMCDVNGVLSRPVHERENHTLVFKAVGQNIYRAPFQLSPGSWSLKLKAKCASEPIPFIQHFRFVKPHNSLPAQ